MWKGRFKSATASAVQEFSESISYDWRLYKHDIRGSLAHARALLEAGILNNEELEAIQQGLKSIEADIEVGTFSFSTELEDVHMNIEAELTKRIGAAGAKLHTARSRNDQVALDVRLYLRDVLDTIREAVQGLQKELIAFARRHPEAVLPGYTHLQRAQPVYFAHHLLAYVEMFARDVGRVEDTRKRLNIMPLGSGAIAGSTICLNRQLVAELLEFPDVTRNSMDAVSDRDFICETLSTLAVLGMHLSRLSEDIILWASSEFGFLQLSDSYTTGSSLMPQKKNPDVAELTRGKTGRLYGNLLSILTTLKGLPMTYNRDLQEDKEPLFDSIDTILLTLNVFTGMISEAKAVESRMGAAAEDPMLLATDLADYLVLKKVPFRHAHEAVGKLTALCVEREVTFHQLTLSDYQSASEAFEEDVHEVLKVKRALQARDNTGAPGPLQIAKQLEFWDEQLQ